MKTYEIKKLRKQLGLTQAEFAALVGVNQPTVSKWEYDASNISRPVAKILEQLERKKPAAKILKQLKRKAA